MIFIRYCWFLRWCVCWLMSINLVGTMCLRCVVRFFFILIICWWVRCWKFGWLICWVKFCCVICRLFLKLTIIFWKFCRNSIWTILICWDGCWLLMNLMVVVCVWFGWWLLWVIKLTVYWNCILIWWCNCCLSILWKFFRVVLLMLLTVWCCVVG